VCGSVIISTKDYEKLKKKQMRMIPYIFRWKTPLNRGKKLLEREPKLPL